MISFLISLEKPEEKPGDLTEESLSELLAAAEDDDDDI